MHRVNYFWVNLGTAYMSQCISVTDIAHLLGQFFRIYKKIRTFVHITIHVPLCILKGSLLSMDIFWSHLVLIIYWLQKQVSLENEPQQWLLEFSATQKVTQSRTTRYSYGAYL